MCLLREKEDTGPIVSPGEGQAFGEKPNLGQPDVGLELNTEKILVV